MDIVVNISIVSCLCSSHVFPMCTILNLKLWAFHRIEDGVDTIFEKVDYQSVAIPHTYRYGRYDVSSFSFLNCYTHGK